jgi:hypothetical protein
MAILQKLSSKSSDFGTFSSQKPFVQVTLDFFGSPSGENFPQKKMLLPTL